jgi:hypothetical protein
VSWKAQPPPIPLNTAVIEAVVLNEKKLSTNKRRNRCRNKIYAKPYELVTLFP